MKFYKLLLLAVIFGGLALNCAAQMCGRYNITVSVTDANDQPINNAKAEFAPVTIDETRGVSFVRDEKQAGVLFARFLEGHEFKEFHKLIVSADGYKTAETEIRFYSCQRRTFKVKLPVQDSAAVPFWDVENEVAIRVKDENGESISDSKLTVLKDGKSVISERVKNGETGFYLPFGQYVFRVKKKNYQTEDVAFDMDKIHNPLVIVKLKPLKDQ